MSDPPIPADIASLEDYEHHARERMSPQAWSYFSGAAADGITDRENRAAFDRLRLNARVLRDFTGATTRLELLGRELPYPILLAPVAWQKIAHAEGEAATALAAAAMGATMVASTQSSVAVAEIAARTSAPLWFQLYARADRDGTRELVQRAEAAGCEALVLTVDAPVSGARNSEQRSGFALPPGMEAPNLQGLRRTGRHTALPGHSPVFGSAVLRAAITWADLPWLMSLTRLPVLLKGITHPDDARIALDHGVAGLILSNHGGRTLDTLPATVELLPAMVAAVGNRIPVLVDGGIRRGTDILKALALGARAVLIGRPYIYGLTVGGAPGVVHVLHILRTELELAMALTGCRKLEEITAETLWRGAGPQP